VFLANFSVFFSVEFDVERAHACAPHARRRPAQPLIERIFHDRGNKPTTQEQNEKTRKIKKTFFNDASFEIKITEPHTAESREIDLKINDDDANRRVHVCAEPDRVLTNRTVAGRLLCGNEQCRYTIYFI
jgi:hypothetical protein